MKQKYSIKTIINFNNKQTNILLKMLLEWISAGLALFGTLGAVYLFSFDPAKAIYANASNLKTISPHMVDCLRMLVPPYLGLSILPIASLMSKKNAARFYISLVLCIVFCGNVTLESLWLISGRWNKNLLFYMAGDISITISQFFLAIRYFKRMRIDKAMKNE